MSFRVSESLIFTTGLPIVIGSGTAQQIYTATTPTLLRLSKGTTAVPDATLQPTVKSERLISILRAAVTGDGAEQLNAGLTVCAGDAANQVQTVGYFGGAKNEGTSNGGSGGVDACGIYGVGLIHTAGVGVGIGGYFNGRRETNTGKANGIEVSVDNATVTAGTYLSTGFSSTTGAWVHATGTAQCGVGIAIGNPFNIQLDVGIGITSQGTGGPVLNQSFRDDSQAATSIQINGTHATAALSIAAAAGQLLVGGIASVFAITNNIAEFQGSNNNVDGLVAIGSVANQKDYTLRIRNSSGQFRIGIVGTAGSFMTGTAAGDAVAGTTSASKFFHMGGTLKVISVGTANTLGFFATTPIAQYATTGTLVGFTAATTTPVLDGSTFTGNTGATAYTIGDIVRALKLFGLIAA